jgi:hypothetical protein
MPNGIGDGFPNFVGGESLSKILNCWLPANILRTKSMLSSSLNSSQCELFESLAKDKQFVAVVEVGERVVEHHHAVGLC